MKANRCHSVPQLHLHDNWAKASEREKTIIRNLIIWFMNCEKSILTLNESSQASVICQVKTELTPQQCNERLLCGHVNMSNVPMNISVPVSF